MYEGGLGTVAVAWTVVWTVTTTILACIDVMKPLKTRRSNSSDQILQDFQAMVGLRKAIS